MATINRAPWTALVDDSGQNLDGSIWNKAAIKTVLLDPIDAAIGPVPATAAWTPYTPTWSGGDAVQPTLGNGFLDGRSSRAGNTCHFVLNLRIGSTTVIGTSSYWLFGLPFPATGATGAAYGLLAAFLNAGGGGLPPGNSFTSSPTQVYAITAAGGLVGPTAPFAWTSGCQLFIRGTYETF